MLTLLLKLRAVRVISEKGALSCGGWFAVELDRPRMHSSSSVSHIGTSSGVASRPTLNSSQDPLCGESLMRKREPSSKLSVLHSGKVDSLPMSI